MIQIAKFFIITTVAISLSLSEAVAQISFTAVPSQGCSPLAVTFTNTSSVGSSYYMYFDDGTGDYFNSADTTHTYLNPGYYYATMYAYDNIGNYIGYFSSLIQVEAAATSFYMSATSVCPGANVDFNSNTSGNSFFWDFGDGDTASGQWSNHVYATFGTYAVSLITDGVCGIDTIIQTISVDSSGAPSTGFGFWPEPVCPGQPVNFYPFSQNGVAFAWDFGDGDSSTLQNPVHPYVSTGTYTITYTITNSCGNSGTGSALIEVKDNAAFPPMYFSQSQDPACPGESIRSETVSNFLAYVWNAGDGSPQDSSADNWMDHVYNNPGTYIQQVKVYDYCGNDTTLLDTLVIDTNVGLPDQPWFVINAPALVCPGEDVFFDAPGGFLSYVFDYGDGSPQDSIPWNGNSHVYPDTGSFVISVRIYNYCGSDSLIFHTLTVDNNAGFQPGIGINFNTPACPGSASLGGPSGQALYVWNYGDGSPVDSTTWDGTNHVYDSIGVYPLALTIVNYCGNDTTVYDTLVVASNVGFPGFMSVDPYPNPVCPGDRISLNADYGYSSYYWDFGDGTNITTGDNWTEHYYASAGTYNFSVKITNGCGMDTTITGAALVDTNAPVPPQATMNVSGTVACPGDVINFDVNDEWDLYSWNFGDGDTLTTTDKYVSHAYDSVGSYQATVTITNGCGNQRTLKQVIVVDSNNTFVDATVSTLNSNICPGDLITIGPMDDNGSSYLYYWDLGDGTLDTTLGIGVNHAYADTGVYNVSVIATNGCGYSASHTLAVTVSGNAAPSLGQGDYFGVAGEGEIAGCAGDAILFYFAGVYANTWDFGDGSSGSAVNSVQTPMGEFAVITHVYQNTGYYWATLTITNNCGNSITDSTLVVIGSGLAVNGEFFAEPPTGGGPFTTCQGVKFLAMGGVSYYWNYGDGATVNTSSSQVTHYYDSAGTYNVSVTMTNACGNTATYVDQINVVDGGGPAASSAVTVQLTCYGGSDATALAAATGGSLPYAYLWSDPAAQTTAAAVGLSAGTYSVTVSDNVGCADVSSVTVTSPAQISGTGTMTPANCEASDGSVSITSISGGTAPYTYLWNNGDTSATADSLPSGSYSVTVTDANGCTGSQTVVLNDVGGVSVSGISATNVSCNGGSDGAVDITLTGGTPPYSYSWSTADTVEDISGLTAGYYSVTVTDSAGCKTIQGGSITEPAPLSLTTSVVSANCGASDGSISATAGGGTPAYSYSWSNGATTAVNAGISAGTYLVTVTDLNLCSAIFSVTVGNANAPSLSASVSNISCNGGSDGFIDLSVSGGTTPYTYLWLPNGSFSQDLSNLTAGSYTIILYDGGGCQVAKNIVLTQPAALTTALTATGEHCNSVDGAVLATVTGGTAAYTYLWSTGATDASDSGLTDGSYSVTVTDAHGCSDSSAITVTDIAGPVVSVLDSVNVSCFGYSDGTATATASGGTGVYTYSWNDTGLQTSAQATGLPTGSYRVTVTDSAGCSDSAGVTLEEPAVLSALITASTNVSCYSACDGSATVAVTGGTSPYFFAWDDPGAQSSATATGLCSDTLNIAVTDSNGCTANDAVIITEPVVLALSTSDTNISCYGGSDGGIDLTVTGGTTPYSYAWSSSDTTEDLTGIAAGIYDVVVTDANGCQDSTQVTLTEEAQLVMASVGVDAHCGQADGAASTGVTGGVPAYTYAWDDPGTQTTPAASGLADGVYHVMVTDSFGCTALDSVVIATTVDTISICVVTVDSTSSMNVVVWDKPAPGLGVKSVNVYRDVVGTYTLVGNVLYNELSEFKDTTNGVNPKITSYRYKIAIVDSCSNEGLKSAYHETINLTPVAITGGDATLIWDNYEGFNFSYYRILRDTTGSGNWEKIDSVTNANFTYVDLNAPQVSNLRYMIEVVTGSVCVASKGKNYNSSKSNTSSMNNGTAMSSSVSANDASQGVCDGSATVTVTSGTLPYTYVWNDSQSQTTATASGLCAGNYSVTVYDANGDSLVDNAVIGTLPGFEEFDLGNYAEIYPNPNSGKFIVRITAPGLDLATIEVFAVDGRLLYRSVQQSSSGEIREQFDLSGSGPGVYYVNLVSARGTTVKKIVVR